MSKDAVTIRLDQRQRELIDKTIERGLAVSPEDILKKALKEYWRDHMPDGAAAGLPTKSNT